MFIYGKRILGLFLIITMSSFCGQWLSAMWPFNRCTKKVVVHPDNSRERYRFYSGELEPMDDHPSGRPSRALSAPVGDGVDDKIAEFYRTLSVPTDGSIKVRSMVNVVYFSFPLGERKPISCAEQAAPVFMAQD